MPIHQPPAVSIITPTYNHAAFLPECLASVQAQSSPDWEQLVIDDGSTDATPEIMAACTDPRVRYVRQEHRGVEDLPATYNRALALCRAPLIAILEGDDTWPADKLAALVPAFDDPDVVLAYGVTEVVGDGRGAFGPAIPQPDFGAHFPPGTLSNDPPGRAAVAMLDLRGLTFTYPCSVILRRAALERIGGFLARPELPVTDYPTFLALALEGRFHFEPRTMGYWRVHAAGTTVRRMDEILHGIHREATRFRAAEQARLPAADWSDVDARWRVELAGLAMRDARRHLVDGRWAQARSGLVRVLAGARWGTRLSALLALAGSFAGTSVEWLYRLTGRTWFRRATDGKHEVVFPGRGPDDV